MFTIIFVSGSETMDRLRQTNVSVDNPLGFELAYREFLALERDFWNAEQMGVAKELKIQFILRQMVLRDCAKELDTYDHSEPFDEE